jgi:ribonuclease HII
MKLYKNIDNIEVGIDEAGRGSLIGRVYVGAVIWHKDDLIKEPFIIQDSKKITRRRRAILKDFIQENAVEYSVAYAEPEEIDQENILKITLRTMHRALKQLKTEFDSILVDGPYFNEYYRHGIPVEHECVVGGDGLYKSIACGSILAKEYHDQHINELCDEYPQLEEYGLRKNVGYGTKQHMKALQEYGVTKFHRMSYAPCAKISVKNNLD